MCGEVRQDFWGLAWVGDAGWEAGRLGDAGWEAGKGILMSASGKIGRWGNGAEMLPHSATALVGDGLVPTA